jgi:hypothetical protein
MFKRQQTIKIAASLSFFQIAINIFPITAATAAMPSGSLMYLSAVSTSSYPAGGGSTWYDLSGNNYNGTLMNFSANPATGSGSNRLIPFVGSSSQYVDMPDESWNFSSGITISGTMDWGSTTSFERMMDFGLGAGNTNLIVYRYSSTSDIGFMYYKADGTNPSCVISGGIASGMNNYTVTADGTNIVWYRNGTNIGSCAASGYPSNATRTLNYIGASNWVDPYLEGSIRGIAIWNRVLSGSEITQAISAFTDTTPPVISTTSFSAAENQTSIGTLSADETVTWSKRGGVDSATVSVVAATGVLTFISAPDFEAPTDVGANNVYDVIIRATDTAGNATDQAITITVTNVVDTSSFNSFALSGSATYRTVVQINANVTVAAKVTFKANNLRIPGCLSVRTSGTSPNIIAVCNWKPSRRGPLTLSATAVPTTGGITSSSATPLKVLVANRTSPR